MKKDYLKITVEEEEEFVPKWNTWGSFTVQFPLLTSINVLSRFFR